MTSAVRISTLATSASPSPGGLVELHVVQHHYLGRTGHGALSRPTFLLINLDQTPEAPTAFSALPQAFGYSRQVFSGRKGPSELASYVEDSDQFVDGVVIYTGTGVRPEMDASMRDLASRMRSLCSGSVVTAGAWRWKHSSVHLREFPATTPSTAMSALLLLAGLCAPACLLNDNGDVFEQQGPLRRQAELAEAIWLRDSDTFVYDDAAAESAVRQAVSVVVLIVGTKVMPADLARIKAASGAGMDADWACFVREPAEALFAPCLPPEAVGLTLVAYSPPPGPSVFRCTESS